MPELGNEKPWMGPLPAVPGCDCHICRPEESYDDTDRQSIDMVLKHGWQVILVADSAKCSHPDHDDRACGDDEPGPAFAYTVGLGHRAGHPELLMSGLDPGVMHHALNEIAGRVMSGRRFAPGGALEDVLAGVPVALEDVAETALADTVLWSGWFHRRKPEALAVIWPTKAGVFAWQPGAPEILDELQPPSWRVPITHTGGLASDPTWDFPVPPDHRAFSCTHVVDGGEAVLWTSRQSDVERGEDWTIHCGAERHEIREMRVVHLAHLVRSAPGLRQISDLPLDAEALRTDTDSAWRTAHLP